MQPVGDVGDGVAVVRGAADVAALRRVLPGTPVSEIGSLAELGPAAASVGVLVLRSGVVVGATELARLSALRHVVRAGSGTDGIDLGAMAARGITLHRNPVPAAQAVGEWVLTAFVALARRVPLGHNAAMIGRHYKTESLSRPPTELTVAIWGAGAVGRASFAALSPYAARLYFAGRAGPESDPSQPPVAGLLDRADAHVLALPLTAATAGWFGPAVLARAAPRTPLVICAGRVGTLDLPACLAALAGGRLGGLAVDPVEEPDLAVLGTVPGPLNLLVTPHLGAQRTDVRAALDDWVVDTLQSLLGRS